MANQSYREQINAKRIQNISTMLKDLPPSCNDFILSIAVTTSTFTRLAYTIDLCTFFHYLQSERFAFSDKPLYAFTDSDISKITQSDLIAYTDYLALYYKTDENDTTLGREIVNHELSIKRKLCSLRSYFEFLFRANRIPSNVTQLIDLPKIHQKPIIRLNRAEVQKILYIVQTGQNMTKDQQKFHKLTSKRDYAMISLFLGTGIRVSECVGINLSDIDMQENAFLVTRKGGNQVILYFPPEVAEALADYMEERNTIEPIPGHEDALFLSIQRKRISQRSVQNLVKKYAGYATPLKTKISPHKLRSTFATNLYNATGDIYLVADVLGHSSVDTTRKHYADMTEQRRRSAANYVKLPEKIEESASTELTPLSESSVESD